MAFDTEKRNYAKEHLWYIEIEIDSTVYRFCENRSPMPRGLSAIPSLRTVRVNPAEIDLEGGIGVRAKCTVTLMESDDYTAWGTIANPERFWARWRAENPYYLGQRISVYSGYIRNGSLYFADDFVRRDYIIESFSQTGAGVSITGKDPLKLASNDRAKAPVESTGSLSGDILSTDTSLTLEPLGVGDDEYPEEDFYIRISDEVMYCSARSGDDFTVVRAQFNTEADDHDDGDTAQLCLYYEDKTVDFIDNDLLTTYAGVDPSYIPYAAWQAEVNNSFITTYTALITEPTGVQDLMQEFAQSAPHYSYWDERVNLIQLKALKPPPSDAQLLTYQGNLIAGSTAVTDKQDLRVSTVIVNYGIIDPTKDLEEISNYRASYIREDSDSVTDYGQRAYKTVYSRWIESDNKTAAVLIGARIGRRFASSPRMIGFSLDAKDSDVWTGDSVKVQSDLIMQSGGGYPSLFYQILSAGESSNYDYTALEHTYGDALPQDEDVEDPDVRLVYIKAGEVDRLADDGSTTARTLREYYIDTYGSGTIESQLDIRFIFESNTVAGSSTNTEYAVKTGAWPELTTPILIINNGLIIGKGGDGGGEFSSPTDGGAAILLEDNIRLNNLGIIGGGGAGGSYRESIGDTTTAKAAGGGGAGYTVGTAGTGTNFIQQDPQDGTYTEGGEGGTSRVTSGFDEGTEAFGEDGSDLGVDAPSGDAFAGAAIDADGFSIEYVNIGTIYGDINDAVPVSDWATTGNTLTAPSGVSDIRGAIQLGGGFIYLLANSDHTVYRYSAYAYDAFSASVSTPTFSYDLSIDSNSDRFVTGNGGEVARYNSSWVYQDSPITLSNIQGFCELGSSYYGVTANGDVTIYNSSFTSTGSFSTGLTDVVGISGDGTKLYYAISTGSIYSSAVDGTSLIPELSTSNTVTGVNVVSDVMIVSTGTGAVEYNKP